MCGCCGTCHGQMPADTILNKHVHVDDSFCVPNKNLCRQHYDNVCRRPSPQAGSWQSTTVSSTSGLGSCCVKQAHTAQLLGSAGGQVTGSIQVGDHV